MCLYDPQAPDGLPQVEQSNADHELDKEERMGDQDGDGDATGMKSERIENGESEMDVEQSADSESQSTHNSVGVFDQLLFSSLSTLRKICIQCSIMRGSTYCEIMNRIWGELVK